MSIEPLDAYPKQHANTSGWYTSGYAVGVTRIEHEGTTIYIVPVAAGYECETLYTEELTPEQFERKFSLVHRSWVDATFRTDA